MNDIQRAFVTLSDPFLRAALDARLIDGKGTFSAKDGSQRPAEVVSFDEFTPLEEGHNAYTYPCRCGASYRITEDQLEADVHLMGCQGCSEVIWIGYEVADE